MIPEWITVAKQYEDFASSYVDRWSSCEMCVLHHKTRTRPMLRGFIPADVLFVGEAPGESEDALGEPFIGPARKLLDFIILKSLTDNGFRYLIANCVVCTPPRVRGKIRQPLREEKDA